MNDFLTIGFVGTFAGVVLVIGLVTSVVVALVPALAARTKWIAFVTALIILLVLAFYQKTDLMGYFMAVLNAFLVTATVIGVNTVTTPFSMAQQDFSAGKPAFWHRW
jgi:hypothetical protein